MTEDGVTPINERARLFASICFCQIHDGPDSTDLDQMEHDFDAWLAAERAKVWQEAADEISQQGTIQIPDNPYEEGL